MNTLKFNSVKSFQEFLEAFPEVSGKVVLEVSVPSEEVKKTVVTFSSLDEYAIYLTNNPSFTGTAIVLHQNGRKNIEHNFVNGKPHGEYRCWFPSGQKAYEKNFVDGRLRGKQHFWHKNGQMWYEEER